MTGATATAYEAREAAPTPGAGLAHPVALLAIAMLVLNDHVGKVVFPGLVTGKLSDVAGLVFFPLFLQAGIEWALAGAGRPWHRSDRVLGVAVALTAAVFALVKLDTPFTELYRSGLGALQWPWHAGAALLGGSDLPGLARVRIATDPTDLVALPAVLVAWTLRRRQEPRSG